MAHIPGYVVYEEPPRRPLTAQNLDDFALCPQKFLLSFFVPPEVSARRRGGSAALHEAVREALVQAYRGGGPPRFPAERLLEVFERAWRGELCADSREEEQLHAQGREMLERYHREQAGEPVRALAADLRLEEEIGGHRFVAVADRVDEEEAGGLLLLRYKTTRRPPSAAELGRQTSYRLLALLGEEHFERPARVGVYALRPGRVIVAELSRGELEAVQEDLVGQAEALRRAGSFPTHKGRHCRVCRSQAQCPAWHPAAGEQA